MADRKTIQIPVDVQLKIKDQSKAMRGISDEMQDIFANADPGTAFYKSLSKAIVAIEKKLNSADSLLGKEFFSEADLGKTTTLLGGVADILSEISTLAKRTSTIGLGFETDELIQANEALKALQATIRSTKKSTKVGAVSGMLDREEVKRMVASSKDTGFSAGKTFDENHTAMAKSLGKVTEEYVRFQQEAAAAAEIAEKAGKAVAASKVELNMAKGELQTRKDLNTNLAKQIADIKVSGQGATKENIAKQYQDVLLKQLTSVDSEKYAPIIAGWLDISEAELIGTATDIARNLEKAINTAMATGPAAKNKLRINAKSVIDGKAAAFQKDRIYGETEQKVAVATANVDTAEEAAKEAVSNLQAANNTVTQTSNLLATIQSQMAELKKLQAEYNALVDEQHANELNALKTRQQDANYKAREGERIFNKDVKNAQGGAKSGYDIYDQQQINRRLQEEQDRLEKEAARESQEFTDNLKQSIRHWMSAQQVINMVKDGIRQAYQDIKGLDTAMTNIAVVTDMSVSDLWGKINDYMSIAQQYGVTTQGVYEVSQLYYQQGLSTNEVMAATTETLKMARIAGMDYKDAADAMTVAIRAFKMEMTDAEHVTDVYSKVAAVTASDSEELAIAMSKTASSAESVGSSFENTTAMLAVMIETTRESAQNLGSALKSIISRYGEMKIGLTVDSEGEEIDYNKVDTALKSIGISIKDAQGQFRDFDDVIFELSAKWDSLDKNTQRYIATIMAGNRQQSRFIALVDNWERLEEVATSAQDSEDAGLLQYAKTLDSLDTKLNNIKTSFQEFYMSILNGPLIGKGLEFINNIIKGFNKLSKFTTILNIGSIISGIKLISTILINTFSSSFSQISASWKQMLNELALSSRIGGQKAGKNYAAGAQEGKAVSKLSRKATIGVSALSLVGTGLSMAGSAIADKNQEAGTIMSSLGSGLQIGTMVGMINPIAGVIAGALAAIISGIASWPSELEKAQQNLEKAKEAANKANIKRAETKQRVTDLESSIEQIRRLEESRFESDEAEQAWIDANNALYEKFPELAAAFQNGTDAIVDLESAEYLLIQAREKAAEAAKAAAKTAYEEAKAAREEKEAQQAEFEAETVTKYGDENNTTSLTLGLKLAEHLQAERNKYKTEYGGPGAVYDSFAFNKVLTSKTQAFSRPYTQLLTSGIDLYNQDMLHWLFGHENLSEEEILNSFINNLEAGTLKFEEGTTADMAVQKFTNGTYKTASDLIASRNSGRRDAENAQYIENQLDLNQAVVEASTLLDTSYYTEAWLKELEGSASLIEESVKQSYAKSGLSFEEFKSQVPTLVANLANSFSELYNNLYAMGNVDEFSSLIENSLSGQITERDFKVNAQQIFGFEDFDTFISNTEDPLAAALNLYYTDFIAELQIKQTKIITALANNPARQLNWDEKIITNLLQQVPDTYYNEIIAFANSIESKIGAGNLSETQATILIEQYAKIWENLANPDLNLNTEQLASAQQLLSEADLFSITGIQELETGLLKLQINPDIVNSIMENIPIYTANLITEYAQLENKLATNLTNTTDAMKKASQGMELDEALTMASQLGVSIANFDFIDGKWFYKNIEAINNYYTDEANKLKIALESEAARITSLFGDNKFLNNKDTFKTLMSATENQQKLFTSKEKEIYAAFSPYYTDFTKWQTEMGDSLDGKGIATQWAEYFKSLGKEMDNATAKAMEYYNEQSQKEADKAIRLSQIAQQKESIGINEDLITAQQTFAATQGKGLTTDQRYELEKGFGFKDTDFKIDAEGNWELTEEAIQKGLTQLNQAQKNIWVSQIENNSKSALEAIGDLGSKLASGEAGTQEFMDAFGENISQNFQDVLPTLLYNITNNQDRFGRGQAQIRRMLEASGLSDKEIDEAYNKLVASYKDSTNANVIRYFELAEKALKGIITEAESLEFTKLTDSGKYTLTNIQAMITTSGIDLVKNYGILIQDIINQGLPWEQIESQVSSYYESAVGELFNSLGVGDAHQQFKGIQEGDGLYNQSELTSLLTLASKEQLTVDWDKLNAAAKIDQITNEIYFTAYDFISGANEAIVQAFKNSLEQGSVNKKINDIIKSENLITSFEDGITSIYENILNGEVLFEDIQALFTNANITLTNGDIDQITALQNAVKDGNINFALSILDNILAKVSKGISYDLSAIAAAKADIAREAVNSIIDIIKQGSEGSLSEVNLNATLDQLQINKLEFAKYVNATQQGIEISSEGLLEMAVEAVKLYGELPGLGQELFNALSDDSPLKTWKGITDEIKKIEDELLKIGKSDQKRTEELNSQLNILKQMQGVASQNPDDQAFNFMSFDSTGGALDNFKNFTKTTETGWNFIKSAFQDGSRVAATEFNEFIKFLSQGNMSGVIQGTETTFQQLSDAVLSTIDIFGQVDLGAAAKKLNVDMGDIAGAFDGGLDKIAEAQVEYWRQFLEYLMGLKKLEEGLGDGLTLEGLGVSTKPAEVKINGETKYQYPAGEGGTIYDSKEDAYAAWYADIAAKWANDDTNGEKEEKIDSLEAMGWTVTTDESGNVIKVDPPGADATVDYSLLKAWAEAQFPQLNEGQAPIDLTQFAGVPQIAAVLGVSGLTLSDVGLAEVGAAFSKDLTEKISTIIGGVEGISVGTDGSITFTKNDCTFTGIIDPTSGVISFSATNIKGEPLTPGEIAGILNAGNSGIASFTPSSVTISISDLATSYEIKNAGLTIDDSGITGPVPLTDEELAAKLGPDWKKDQTASTEGKLVYKHPSGIILAYDTTTKKIEAKLPEGVEPAQFANLKKVLEAAGYTQISGAIFSPKNGYLTFTIETEAQDIEVPVPGVKNLEDGWQKGLTNLSNWTWDDIGMFINGEVLSFKYNTKTEDLEVTTPSGINVDNSRKVSAWIKSQGYEIVNGTSFQDQDGYVYSFTLKTKTEDLKLDNPAGIDETGLNVDQIFTNNNWVKDEEAGSNTYSKALDGYIVKWNVTAGTIDVVGADGITPVDDATKEAIIKKALGDNYDSTNKIATLANGITAKVTVSKVDPTYTGGTASISGLKFDSETVEVTFKPITDVIDQTIKDYEEKTITIDVNFNPTTPSGKGETPTKSKNPNEHGVNSQVSDVYNALQSNDPITAKEALANLTNTLGDLGEATLTPEELMSLQELFTLLSSDYVGDDVSGLDGTFVNFASALSQISGIFTANASWSTQLNSLLTALSSGALAVTLPALSSFFTTISSSDLTKLSLDEMIIQLEKLNELSVDTELILSIASAISTLGTAWATLPTTDTDLTVQAKDNATGVIRRIQGALDNLKDKVVKIDVENDEKPLTIKVSFIPKIAQEWTGNVNDLGSALADGNVTKLLAGASFANKTLVGELGPELAVYNGRYHLLGRNGAEFVNLPSNAIVFNHKQTEGIVKGQTRIRGTALAEGNVSGPAAAGGIDGAIAAVQDIIAMWQGILNASAQQLANGGSGGGGGGTAQAPTAELQEWYNLSREIARLEQEINNILAERKNLTDGGEYVKNLRKQQLYLNQQLATQQQLYSYQQKQLDRQKQEINSNDVWSQFLIVDENGNLRYRNGNETDGGKGALDVLADLNKKSLAKQASTIKNKYGYKAYDNTGKDITKDLSDEELVQHFFDSLQAQIDSYDALYDTVQATTQQLAELETAIAEIEAEILQNTMELEQQIYDIIVENAEKAIEELEEYTEKLGEANEAYISGLKESLDAEKEQYEKEKSDKELSQLQKRLNLLRRTGGSATEIADLEEQLNEALKDQYFSEQEKLIEELEKTSEQQIEKLEQQITIQQETLEFQKEAGLIWNQVAEIMSGTKDQITSWIEANDSSLIGMSANELLKALQEYHFKVDMYTTDRDETQPFKQDYKNREEAGLWDTNPSTEGSVWQGVSDNRIRKQNLYNMADEETKKAMDASYYNAYMAARQEGKTDEEAHFAGMEAFNKYMDDYFNVNAGTGKNKKYHWGTFLKDSKNKLLKIETGPDGTKVAFFATHEEDLEKANARIFTELKEKVYHYPEFVGITNYDQLSKLIADKNTDEETKRLAKEFKKSYNNSKLKASQKDKFKKWHSTKAYSGDKHVGYYSQGGLVDYTGPAIVHGTPSKPEAFLNAKQTAMISDAVRAAGEGNVLDSIRVTLANLDSSIRSLVTNNITTQSSNITVAPGAVVLNVAKLNDSYDIEELSNDIMNRMVNIASKATNRGVNRR